MYYLLEKWNGIWTLVSKHDSAAKALDAAGEIGLTYFRIDTFGFYPAKVEA